MEVVVESTLKRKASVWPLRSKSAAISQIGGRRSGGAGLGRRFLGTGCGRSQLFGSGRTTLFGLNNL